MVGGKLGKKGLILLLFFSIYLLSFSRVILRSETNYARVNEPIRIAVEFLDTSRTSYRIDGIENFDILDRYSLRSGRGEIIVLRPLQIGRYRLRVRTRDDYSNTIQIDVRRPSSYSSGYNNSYSTGYSSGYNSSHNQLQNAAIALLQGVMLSQNQQSQQQYQQQQYQQQQQTIDQNQQVQKPIQKIASTESYLGDRSDFKIVKKIKDKEIYLGEKVVYEENFRASGLFRSVTGKDRPKFENLSSTDYTPISKSKKPQVKEYESDGKKIIDIMLYRGVIQGNLSGTHSFYSSSAEVVSNSTFLIPAEKVTLNIKPLPEEGKPENFQGVVGNPKVEYKWDENDLEVGKTILMTVRVSGNVNLDSLDKLNYPSNEAFNMFETLKSSKEEIKSGEYYTEKEYEIAFIPKKSGEVTIGQFELNYFNPKTEKYEMKRINEKKFNIKDSIVNQNTEGLNTDNKVQEDKVKEEQIDQKIELVDKTNHKNTSYFWILLSGVVLVGGSILAKILLENKKIIFFKNKDIYTELKKSKNYDEFYEAYSKYMIEKYNFNPKLHSEIKLPNITLKEVNSTLEKWRFKGELFDMEEVINKLKEVDKI